jgi:hypothetical protein
MPAWLAEIISLKEPKFDEMNQELIKSVVISYPF